jgi:lysophospholipase L1-like esterase
VAREAPGPVVAPAASPEPLPPSVGALEGPDTLARFFRSLDRLERGQATDDVRLAQFGDSHTAAEWQTGPVRRALQARFGDGGRGFVPVGRPWKAWSQEGVLTGLAGEWTTQMNRPTVRHATGDGVFGLAGVAMASRQPGARAWVEVLAPTSRAELSYLAQPGGGSFDLIVDGSVSRVATRGEARRSAFRLFDVAEASKHHIEVRPLGDGEVRVFGVALDRAEHGLVFDAFGINGARIATAASWSTDWIEDLRHRAPALVILAYGTNDAMDVETSLDALEAGLSEVLARVQRAAPEASCLVLGPPDRATHSGTEWKTPPRLPETVARSRAAAKAAGCAFYDQVAAMGGTGAMARWAKEPYPRGQPDRVHLTRTGYADLGSSFVTDLVRAYELWRAPLAGSPRAATDPSSAPHQ